MNGTGLYLTVVDLWGREQEMPDDPIFLRALSSKDPIWQSGIAEYEAVYKGQGHYFCNISELVQFISDTLEDGSKGGGLHGKATAKRNSNIR